MFKEPPVTNRAWGIFVTSMNNNSVSAHKQIQYISSRHHTTGFNNDVKNNCVVTVTA